ncbi:Hypothetical predicted protein [Cloeon dipterum]|uniref:AMP-dependent synthetase/ligase domain-containing protein n=1 Tax=Cloeon dipterum TaxID=197152 RepID=A0A8S1DJX4_9INSE|nr:Hypothetical predicted protein [Cloeon dipterum]
MMQVNRSTDYGEILQPRQFPNVTLTDCIFQHLRKHIDAVAEKPWLIDVCTGKKVLFGEVEELAKKVASALACRGFAKGEILYFVTYDIVDMAILQLAVWLLGGATRGSFQTEEPEKFRREMNEVHCKFVAVDSETVLAVKKAICLCDTECTIINVGDANIEGTLRFSDLTKDDGLAFPENIGIDLENDTLLISNTSGTTGMPKGVMHTHKSFVSLMSCCDELSAENGHDESILITANSFAVSNAWTTSVYLATGNTVYCIGRYRKEEFIYHVIKFRPRKLFLYPYISGWLARSPELQKHDFSFIKGMTIAGSVIDPTTIRLLQTAFPNSVTNMAYGQTECLKISLTLNSESCQKSLIGYSPDGEEMVTSGTLFPLIQAKILDIETKKLLGCNKLGKLYIKGLHLMKGYFVEKGKQPNRSCFDKEGWFDTGDVAFFDSIGQLFVRERVSFIFKYFMHFVSPSEIEAILQQHPAVQMACVIGVPNRETTNLAKALVVLKDRETTTEEELLKLVADKLPFYKQLHGGLQFVDSLPENKGRKLDRVAIVEIFPREYVFYLLSIK